MRVLMRLEVVFMEREIGVKTEAPTLNHFLTQYLQIKTIIRPMVAFAQFFTRQKFI